MQKTDSSSDLKFRYVHQYTDIRGKVRAAYRRVIVKGGPRVSIPIKGRPYSRVWVSNYEKIHKEVESKIGVKNERPRKIKIMVSMCENALIKRFNSIKGAAKQRHLSFQLTRDDVAELAEQSKGLCALTGMPFKYDGEWPGNNPFAPSIDRINRNRGYIIENCRVVLHSVNIAMCTWGEEHLKLISDHLVANTR